MDLHPTHVFGWAAAIERVCLKSWSTREVPSRVFGLVWGHAIPQQLPAIWALPREREVLGRFGAAFRVSEGSRKFQHLELSFQTDTSAFTTQTTITSSSQSRSLFSPFFFRWVLHLRK